MDDGCTTKQGDGVASGAGKGKKEAADTVDKMGQDKDGEDMGKEAWPMPHDQNLPLRLKNTHRQFDGKVLKKGNYGVKRFLA